MKEYTKFEHKQKKSGTFTDQNGIIVIATALFLKATIKIIAPDNNQKCPFTSYNSNRLNKLSFWIAHYPTHSETKSDGHFQSLKLALTRSKMTSISKEIYPETISTKKSENDKVTKKNEETINSKNFSQKQIEMKKEIEISPKVKVKEYEIFKMMK